MRPVVGETPQPTRRPIVGSEKKDRRFVFSFRYFKQIEDFGVGDKGAGWFVALFEKLAEISNYDYETLSSNVRAKQMWRLHEINFSARGMRISRSDFDWIPSAYINNSEEFSFFQFQITKGHGRVIGFWDEDGVFNIVLLDPSHNMQPSEYSDYKIRGTVLARTDFAAAIMTIERAISNCGATCGCRLLYSNIQANLAVGLPPSTILISLTDEVFHRATACVSGGLAQTLQDILEVGLSTLEY